MIPLSRLRVAGFALALAALARAEVPTDPPVFSDPLTIENQYFPFEPGAVKVYRGKSDGERIVVVDLYSSETRTFAWNGGNVETRLLYETEFENGEVVEISKNYFAEADDGTVYYFGETVDIYEDGVVVSNEGSWLVGGPTDPDDPPSTADAPDPTVYMPANPEVNDVFKQEDLPPIVDETSTILSVGAKTKTEAGKFKNCLLIRETSSLPDSTPDKKWWAPGQGVVKTKAKGEKLALIASSLGL